MDIYNCKLFLHTIFQIHQYSTNIGKTLFSIENIIITIIIILKSNWKRPIIFSLYCNNVAILDYIDGSESENALIQLTPNNNDQKNE